MKLPRRGFLHLAAGAAALPAISRIARGQSYPSRPVRVVVGFTPGSAPDIIARLMGQWLSERLGQQFVIDNRPGGGGNIGTEAVVRAAPDGYMLLMVGGWNAINATLYDKLSFNFIRDIAPVAGIIVVPNVVVVHPSFPAKTVPEFIAYAKANPGKELGIWRTGQFRPGRTKIPSATSLVTTSYGSAPSRKARWLEAVADSEDYGSPCSQRSDWRKTRQEPSFNRGLIGT
jgi:hypothetical protein